MAVTYTWTVAQLEAYPEHEGKQNVVFTVHWRLDGTDGEHTAGVYGSQVVTLAEEHEFVPFEDLTQEQVIAWVKDALGEDAVAGYEKSVADQIGELANPSVVKPALPWL